MRRRDFIAGLGGAGAWPIAARAAMLADYAIQIIGGRFFGGASGIVSGYPRHSADTGVTSGGMLSSAFALSVLNHSIGEPTQQVPNPRAWADSIKF